MSGMRCKKNIKGGTPMTRLKGCRPLVRAGMVAVVFAATAGIADRTPARADDVTPERLLNADKEAGNWLHHHKNFSATRSAILNENSVGNGKNLKVAWTRIL